MNLPIVLNSWRKVLQVSKRISSFTEHSRFAFALAAFLVAASQGASFADGNITMPTVSGIESPSMPTLSSPTLGEDFYTPGSKTNGIYTGSTSSTATTASSSDNSSNSTSTTSSTNASTSNTSTSTGTSSKSNALSSLSASDISSLGNMGLLSQLFSGSDTSSSTSSLANLYTSSSSNVTNELLKQVLAELEELKKQLALTSKTTAAAGTATAVTQTAATSTGTTTSAGTATTVPTATTATTTTSSTTTSSNTKALHSRLFRFMVNGYDVLKTCRVVYISQVQKDSTFLLTGDRRYQSDGVTRNETFYLLFKSKGVINGQQTYSVAAAVTQDYLNQYSFLYQLSQKNNLTATQIGNLVCLRTTDPSWKLDLLLDLEEQ